MKRILEVKRKIGNLSKSSKNPFFNSEYLNLDDLLNAVEPLLQDEGLVLAQPIVNNYVTSIIIDSENGNVLLESSLELPDLTNPQKIGACITYFRRFTLKSMLSISEKDDDGNTASGNTDVKKTKEKSKFTDEKFQKAKTFTNNQITTLLNSKTYELTKEQRTELETIIKSK